MENTLDDKSSIIKRLNKLAQFFDQGSIPKEHEHEVNPGLALGSRENYLYFTLPVCLNFQRSSPALWRAALDTWNDEQTRDVYFPEKVALIDDDDPHQIIAAAGNDAARLVKLLQADHKDRFPYLRGPKLSNYWPYILSHYTDLRLENAHELSIIPDTHVIQASVKLGLVDDGATAQQVEQAWRDLLHGSDVTPTQMHPILWNWSRNNFEPGVN